MVHKTAYDSKHEKGLKILSPKQMLQTNSTCTSRAGNTSENLLNEICQTIWILCIEKNKLLKKYITI